MANQIINMPEIHKTYRDKLDAESIVKSFTDRLIYSLAKDKYSATKRDSFLSLSYAIRDRLVSRWIKTQQEYYHQDAKRIYYLSMEFLIGRTLGNSLINLGVYNECTAALQELGLNLEEIRELEWDAGLGNGGLGRLAACFLDSMATLQLPAYGYGIRYEYGIFFQHLENGFQVESPDNWLRYGNPWEIGRPEYLYPIKFYGKVNQYTDHYGKLHNDWINTEYVMAMAFDTPVPGYNNNTVNTLRLWSARASRMFNLDYFNSGDYMKAVESKSVSEVISKVLYPNDNTMQGKELRLKQEYFFVSATLQDIIRRYKKTHNSFDQFPDKVAVQLNDTHPAIAISDLMRILIDEEGIPWNAAWEITQKTFAYTNHTILPEALEKWRVSLLKKVLPRHLQIIFEINQRFLDQVWTHYPGDMNRLRNMSIIQEEPEKMVRMANLAVVGSHSLNGVSALHTQILKDRIFKDFYHLMPEKFNNKTNGITQRRWLKLSNPRLSNLITETIGDEWVTDLFALKKLIPLVKDKKFRKKWQQVKLDNKTDFAKWVRRYLGIIVYPDSIFDFQVKRMHEYKRQLLNVMHSIYLYNLVRENPKIDFTPRTIYFGGKAAPGYFMAKLIIKLINCVSHIINNDPNIGGKLKVVFLPNYRVSLAQKIFPASDLSEQISTAGTEASGTGNMKFALNGALTIGTLDGANIEIREEVGKENIFIFGKTADQIKLLKQNGYSPYDYYNSIPAIKKILDMIHNGFFCPDKPTLFHPLVNSLLQEGDNYCLLADFNSYVECQEQVSKTYVNQDKWTEMSIMNVAKIGKFSTDRTIMEYNKDIWKSKPIKIKLDKK